jgi:NADH-quinone oxidoreductase subunit G
VRRLDARAVLAVGVVPVEGEDQTFPAGFTIRAEKCPNRRGIEEVVRHFMGSVPAWDEWLDTLVPAEQFDTVWITGGYPGSWHGDDVANRLGDVPTLIVQDCFESPLWRRATFRLPGATFAEREGSFVNFANRMQSFSWAVRAPAGVICTGACWGGLACTRPARRCGSWRTRSHTLPPHPPACPNWESSWKRC